MPSPFDSRKPAKMYTRLTVDKSINYEEELQKEAKYNNGVPWCLPCRWGIDVAPQTDEGDKDILTQIREKFVKYYGRVTDDECANIVQVLYEKVLREDIPNKPYWSKIRIIEHYTEHDMSEEVTNMCLRRERRAIMKLLVNNGIKEQLRNERGELVDRADKDGVKLWSMLSKDLIHTFDQ
jgi:hypothetical protein